MRPGAPLSPGLIPAGPVARRELFEARRPALAGPHSHRASGPAGALLRPGAPLSPGLIPNRIGDPAGASYEARRPALAGPRKQDAPPREEVHIRGAGFC